MQLLFGVAMLVAGVLVLVLGRPAAGGRLAAVVKRPGMGVATALLMTALVGLGAAFTLAGLARLMA